MKVVLTMTEGSPHFGLLDGLDLPEVQIVTVTTPDELAAEIVDADVLYGFPTADLLQRGKALRWIQSPSAGVNYLQDLTELVENDIVLTNTRGAHGPSIGEHTFALLFAGLVQAGITRGRYAVAIAGMYATAMSLRRGFVRVRSPSRDLEFLTGWRKLLPGHAVIPRDAISHVALREERIESENVSFLVNRVAVQRTGGAVIDLFGVGDDSEVNRRATALAERLGKPVVSEYGVA